MNILVTICARGGSKGIPGKNIKSLAQKPLIAYTIDHGFKILQKFEGTMALSTDSSEIKKVAKAYNLESDYERPAELATDSAGKIAAIRDVLKYYETRNKKSYDYILDLDVTSPMRTIEDITEALELLQQDPDALNIFSVSPPKRNPYFNMVERKENGYFHLVKDHTTFTSRQSSPEVYDMNASFYIYTRRYFNLDISSSVTRFSKIYLMKHHCFDLDEPVDFEFMDFLLSHNKLGFKI